MNEQEKQLLLKDLCARLPCGRIDVTGDIFDGVVGFWTEGEDVDTVDNYLNERYD